MKKTIIVQMLMLFAFGLLSNAAAQPSDAQLKKQLMSPQTVSIVFNGPGAVEWSTTYKKYVWSRAFTRKLKSDEPGVYIIVKGYASYDVMGGRYVYWRNFISSNSYEGIPDLSASDLQALFKKVGTKNFFRRYSYSIVGEAESIAFADEPNFEWHTPNSVSFDVVSVYTTETAGRNERGEGTFRVRIYRDNTKSDWRDPSSSRKTWKIL